MRGVQIWGSPKGHERREVPLPAFLVSEPAEHVADKRADHFHPRELRHTAASLAIAPGADVKVVQQMLGHKSATMTLDLYGHLFDNRSDEVAAALDAARNSRGLSCGLTTS